jgi:hypothetical protein
MTTITRPALRQVRHSVLRGLVRTSAAAFTTPIRSLVTRLNGIAAAGQLGPGREVEVGRWTGARV